MLVVIELDNDMSNEEMKSILKREYPDQYIEQGPNIGLCSDTPGRNVLIKFGIETKSIMVMLHVWNKEDDLKEAAIGNYKKLSEELRALSTELKQILTP